MSGQLGYAYPMCERCLAGHHPDEACDTDRLASVLRFVRDAIVVDVEAGTATIHRDHPR